MTEKQQKILAVALQLFADQGYAATSTSKVAKAAGVSEGLIFRHFGNKEGLLAAIMEYCGEIATPLYAEAIALEDPKARIHKILAIPFNAAAEHHHLWKLIYGLKWQADQYDDTLSAPIRKALLDAFTSLKYDNPEAETEVALSLIDGAAIAVLLRKPQNLEGMREAIQAKYK